VVDDLLVAQHRRVDRDVVDVTLEELRAGPRRVTTNSPVPLVGLTGTDIVALADPDTVDVERFAVRTERRHDVVPLAVVVRRGRRHGDRAAGPHTEEQTSRAVHVDMPVVTRAGAGARVAEADDLAAGRARGPEPRLDGEHVRPVDERLAGHETV